MRWMIFSFLFFSISSLVLSAERPDRLILEKFDFEGPSLVGWEGGVGIARVETGQAFAGKGCLHINLEKKSSGGIYRGVSLPVVKEPCARLLRITLYIKTLAIQKGEVGIGLLKIFDKGKNPEWFDYMSSTLAKLPVAPNWTEFMVERQVGPEVRNLNFYINMGNSSGRGQVWLDDISLELLDRGLLIQTGKEGNVFTDNQGQVDLIVSGTEKLKAGTVQLFDEEKRMVGQAALERGKRLVKVDLPTRGYYEIVAQAEYEDGVRCQTSLPAAVVGPLISKEERMKSPFGLSGDGNLFLAAGARWDRRFVGLQREELKKAAETNFKNPLPYPSLEVSDDRTSIYCFWPQPAWLQDRKDAATGNAFDMYPMKDWDMFRKLVAYAVKNMSKKPLEYVEVSNEPDGWKGPWTGLVRYHKEMAEAVKSVSPTTKILGPCLCTIKVNELQMLHKLGLFKYIDGLSIHAYVRSTAPEYEFIDLVRKLKVFMASIGKKDMPIFFTEYGWPVPPGDWQKPVDPLTQARYVSRSLILLMAEQIDVIQYFCMRWADPNSGAYGYGLLNFEWTPRPSYPAYATAARFLTGVRGPGKVLKLTPTTYLALFQKGTGTLAAVWDVKEASPAPEKVFVPRPWRAARDMMGRPVKEAADSLVAASPSPVFAESADPGFYLMKTVKTIPVQQGRKIFLPWVPVWAPGAFTLKEKSLTVSKSTPQGEYLVIGKLADKWESVKIRVDVPLEIQKTEVVWPTGEKDPKLQVTINSTLPASTPLTLKMKLAGTRDLSISGQAGSPFSFPLSLLEPGKRYRGTLYLTANIKETFFRTDCPLDLTVVSCRPFINWENIQEMDFSKWSPFSATLNEVDNIPPQDCSAKLQAGYTDEGLQIRITVRDNDHQQKNSPKEMWQEDSIQLGLDLDADQPWRPNVGGYDGHFRVFEYGAALGEKGPMVWRWISYRDNLPADMEEKQVRADIVRKGELTVYTLCFPWATLGLTQKPASGSTIGFSLVVNDFDKSPSDRKGLTLFKGIIDKKDPAEYGKMWVR
jgi:hypothetical protein